MRLREAREPAEPLLDRLVFGDRLRQRRAALGALRERLRACPCSAPERPCCAARRARGRASPPAHPCRDRGRTGPIPAAFRARRRSSSRVAPFRPLGFSSSFSVPRQLRHLGLGAAGQASPDRAAKTILTASAESARESTAPASAGGSRTEGDMAAHVLIVDDDPAECRHVEEIVRSLGHLAESVFGGEAALARLARSDAPPVSAVILDLVMPDLDGMAVLERLTRHSLAMPVIVLTAPGGADAGAAAMRAGALDFLVKPRRAGAPARLARQCAEDRRAGGRDPAHAAHPLRHAGARRHRHARPGDGARSPARRAGRALPHPRPDRGRARRRQGGAGPRHPRLQRRAAAALRRR